MTKPSDVATIRLTQIGHDRCVPAKAILKEARKAVLHEVVIVGRDENAELWCRSSLNASQTLWLIEQLKRKLFDGGAWDVV